MPGRIFKDTQRVRDFGCLTITHQLHFGGVDVLTIQTWLIYPNPVVRSLRLA